MARPHAPLIAPMGFALLLLAGMATVAPEREAADEAIGDRQRVQAHLSQVAKQLRLDPPERLTPSQASARRITLEWLDDYRQVGVFPHNHVRAATRTPVFVDPHGTPCAVGYLLLRSGEHELVEEIVQDDNLIRIPELRHDPRLRSWLDSRGITLEEAAMIQPVYGPPPPDIGAQNTSHYVPATVGLSIASAALASYHAMAGTDSGAPLVDGLLVGAAIGHLYLLASDDSGEHHTATGFNALGALVSIGTEVVRLMNRRSGRAASQQTLSPLVAPGRNGIEVGLLLRN